MLKALVYSFIVLVAASMVAADPKQGPVALLLAAVMGTLTTLIIRNYVGDKEFLTPVFLGALGVRLLFGIIIHTYDLRGFAGSDALFYDESATRIAGFWLSGNNLKDPAVGQLLSVQSVGWGMQYLTAIIYLISDNSILAAQAFCSVIGAATAPMVYVCSHTIFGNRRAARTAAVLVAFCPSFIIWSSQLLKDGLIVFLVVLCLTLVIQLQKQFSWIGVIVLASSLVAVLSLRFYIFYLLVGALVGSFFIGLSNTMRSLFQRVAIVGFVAVALFAMGIFTTAAGDVGTYASLERVQMSRADLTTSAQSGYGRSEDVSTVGGALSALPLGFVYLMFSPFPWEVSNLRQSTALPDVLLWWGMMPLLVYGLWYGVKNRLRIAMPILSFTAMLTLSYSLYLGNVGIAYRQRTQIQVFLFMFVAVGWSIWMEKRADKKLIESHRIHGMVSRQKARLAQTQLTQ